VSRRKDGEGAIGFIFFLLALGIVGAIGMTTALEAMGVLP